MKRFEPIPSMQVKNLAPGVPNVHDDTKNDETVHHRKPLTVLLSKSSKSSKSPIYIIYISHISFEISLMLL